MRPFVLCDIDGTLAIRGDRAPHDHDSAMEDHVNWPIVHLCNILSKSYDIVLISGRSNKYRDVTEYWLWKHNILKYKKALYMRLANDNRSDEVVKEELYLRHIKPVYFIPSYVLDDRNKVVAMWRRHGLTCLQVADGDF